MVTADTLANPSEVDFTRHLDHDVLCPECGYNLRTKAGPVIRCQECGTDCDVSDVVENVWLDSWRRVPVYRKIHQPVIALFTAPLVVAFLSLLFAGLLILDDWRLGAAIVLVGTAIIWVWSLSRVYRLWGGWWGVGMSLLSHVSFLLAAAGLIQALAVIIGVLQLDAHDRWEPYWLAVSLPAAVVCCVTAWFIERGIGKACVANYLANPKIARKVALGRALEPVKKSFLG